MINITSSKTHKIGWRVEPKFKIILPSKDFSILLQIQQY
jgi:hypothetical protein